MKIKEYKYPDDLYYDKHQFWIKTRKNYKEDSWNFRDRHSRERDDLFFY